MVGKPISYIGGVANRASLGRDILEHLILCKIGFSNKKKKSNSFV